MKGLDIEALRKRKKFKSVSYDEAIKEVAPINWSQEVLRGERKIILSGGKNCDKTYKEH